MRLVILRLIEDKPRHGYEIIKAIEEAVGGAYSPSPGVIYPTLTLLEELGYVAVTPGEGARKLVGRTIRGRTAHSSTELAELVLDEAEVAVVPGEAFGSPGYFRMSYALGDDDLVEGVTRLQKLLAEAQ